MVTKSLIISGGEVCTCGKKLSFLSEADANQFIEENPNLSNLKGTHKCTSGEDVWHVTSHVNGAPHKFAALERELHREMATAKTIRQRIMDYMWDSYQRNKTVKYSSGMVVFAL